MRCPTNSATRSAEKLLQIVCRMRTTLVIDNNKVRSSFKQICSWWQLNFSVIRGQIREALLSWDVSYVLFSSMIKTMDHCDKTILRRGFVNLAPVCMNILTKCVTILFVNTIKDNFARLCFTDWCYSAFVKWPPRYLWLRDHAADWVPAEKKNNRWRVRPAVWLYKRQWTSNVERPKAG